jgi:hypothetical protein
MLDLARVQLLLSNQSSQSARGSDDDVGASLLLGELLVVGGDGGSTIEDLGSDIGHELGESSELVLDLVGQFSGVTEDDDRDLAVDGLTEGQTRRICGESRVLIRTFVANRQGRRRQSYPYQTWLDTRRRC